MFTVPAELLAALVPVGPALVGAGAGWLVARRYGEGRPAWSPVAVGLTVALALYAALFVLLWIAWSTTPSDW